MSITGAEVAYSVWGPNLHTDNNFISCPKPPDGSEAHPGSYSIGTGFLAQEGD